MKKISSLAVSAKQWYTNDPFAKEGLAMVVAMLIAAPFIFK